MLLARQVTTLHEVAPVDNFLNLVISGIVTGAIYSIMASGLVLTYQTSGIFNFAHGAIAFATGVLLLPAPHRPGRSDHPGGDPGGPHLRPADGHRPRRDPAPAACVRRRSTPASSARSASSSRCRTSRSGSSRRSATTCSASTSRRSPTSPAWAVTPPASAPTRRTCTTRSAGSGSTRSTSTPTSSRCSSPPPSRRSSSGTSCARRAPGLEMRAVVDRDTLAALRGINQSRSSQIAWILTMILAGLGGVLITPLFQLNPDLFTLVVLGSLAAVAISGLRSIPIAFAGGHPARRRPEPRRRLQGHHPPELPRPDLGPRVVATVLPHPGPAVLHRARPQPRRRLGGRRAARHPTTALGLPGVAAPAPVGARHDRDPRLRAAVDQRRRAPGRHLRAGPDRARSRATRSSSCRSSS